MSITSAEYDIPDILNQIIRRIMEAEGAAAETNMANLLAL